MSKGKILVVDHEEVVRQIKKVSPETEVVLISGRPDGFGCR